MNMKSEARLHRPFFSIIIATYNSERTLGYTLESIKNQSIAKDEIEVMVIDGGSTDTTLEIAESYGAAILENPKKLPEYAKAVGVSHAHGHFVMRMDSDEEFSYEGQLQEKMDFLMVHPEIKMLLPNRIISGRKEICGIAAEYMNVFGDPFSYFIYRTKKDKYETYSRNIIVTDGRHAVMRFEKGDIYPLADSATSVLSLEYMKERFPEEYDTIEFTCGAYDRVIDETGLCGCMRGDDIKHNCSSSFGVYLSKLRFRVINNLFHKEESGFSSKEKNVPLLSQRKRLFCLYALILPVPFIDSIRLAIIYRKPSFLLHFVYLYYVCFQIAKFGVIKVLGGERSNTNYG